MAAQDTVVAESVRASAGTPRAWVCAVIGLAMLAVGVGLVVAAGLGVASWDVLAVGVAHTFGVTVGTAVTLTGLVVLVLALLWGVRPGWLTLGAIVAFGPTVDLVLWASAPVVGRHLAIDVGVLLVGALAVAAGVALYVVADVGFSPHDSLLGAAVRRGVDPGVAKAVVDVCTTGLGWALGGTVGAGTVVVLLVTPPLVSALAGPARRLVSGPSTLRGADAH